MKSKLIFEHAVEGAPVQPGAIVRIVAAVDVNIYDVSEHIGSLGIVKALDYEVGALFPDDPMVHVVFPRGRLEVFWRPEFEVVRASKRDEAA